MKSKLSDISYLARDSKLRPHIPTTRPFTQSWLKEMLKQHPIVYIKPDSSLKGIGVIRIDKKAHASIVRVQDTKKFFTHTDFPSIWSTVNQMKRKKPYIIQQGISSLTSSKNPFDVRSHLLRVNGEWLIGGMICKVAGKQNIVTNGSAGGFPISIEHLVTSYLKCTPEEALQVKSQLKAVSLNAVHAMRKKHPNWCEYGLDLGIDSHRHVWIYEINTNPGATGFKEIDLPSYRRICSLRKKIS